MVTSSKVTNLVNAIKALVTAHNGDSSAHSSLFDAKAPKSHAVNASTYGLGTTGVYGHCKTVNNVTTSAHSNGLALSAYQGKVLKGLVDAKVATSSISNNISSSSTNSEVAGAKAVYDYVNDLIGDIEEYI